MQREALRLIGEFLAVDDPDADSAASSAASQAVRTARQFLGEGFRIAEDALPANARPSEFFRRAAQATSDAERALRSGDGPSFAAHLGRLPAALDAYRYQQLSGLNNNADDASSVLSWQSNPDLIAAPTVSAVDDWHAGAAVGTGTSDGSLFRDIPSLANLRAFLDVEREAEEAQRPDTTVNPISRVFIHLFPGAEHAITFSGNKLTLDFRASRSPKRLPMARTLMLCLPFLEGLREPLQAVEDFEVFGRPDHHIWSDLVYEGMTSPTVLDHFSLLSRLRSLTVSGFGLDDRACAAIIAAMCSKSQGQTALIPELAVVNLSSNFPGILTEEAWGAALLAGAMWPQSLTV